MLIYKCRVINTLGDITEVIHKSPDIIELKIDLKNQGLTLLSSKTVSRTGIKLNKTDILNFTQTLSLLLNSKLSLKDSIEIAITTFRQKKLKSFSIELLNGLNRGDSFSDLLKEHGSGFPPLFIGLINVGEKTGTLSSVLNQLGNYLDRDKKFRDKVTGALVYPIFIISMTLIFSVLFVIVILPKFNQMFKTLGGGVGNILRQRGEILTTIVIIFVLIVFLIIIYVLVIQTLKKEDYNKAAPFEKLYLKLPFAGKLILENETLNLIFALTVLSKSSLSIEQSLDYGKEVLTNSFVKVETELIKNRIITGDKLSEAFNLTIFPKKVSSFIKVGEKTGNIDEIFSQLTDYYFRETDKKIDRLMGLIDPIFTLLIGLSLFSLILLFILPILTKMGDLL